MSIELGPRHNEQLMELMMRVKEWREYLQEAREKCLDWVEKSRPYFGSHKNDEEYEAIINAAMTRPENEPASEMSEARRLRDSSPVSEVSSGTPPGPKDKPVVFPRDMPFLDILAVIDRKLSNIGMANAKSLRLLQV